MNWFIETLNHWGTYFAGFAWPMFWQSSLLISVLLAVDLVLRRRVRASARYLLWLVVLVKLCLPPTLALPTSPAWWMHGAPPQPLIVRPPAVHYVVTYSEAPMAPLSSIALPPPPAPKLAGAVWLLAVCAGVSVILLMWLLMRWWQVVRRVRSAEESLWLTALCREVQQSLEMKSAVRVKIAPNMMSPAVCGLFRPTILIPRVLRENFSEEQIRAVLLHELIHLRRQDVWANFAQSLLQIVYWWHPLVWVANGRIRQVREEAVDDAVMVALNEDADAYAPTLLEVARLALNRPMASLGLVGILESRQALRQRIERLMDFRPPRRAGLTLASVLGIVAFTAVAVPMGQGPQEKATTVEVLEEAPVASSSPATNQQILIEVEIYEFKTNHLSQVSFNFDHMDYDTASRQMVGTIADGQLDKFRAKVKSQGGTRIARPRIVTNSGMPAEFYMSKTNGADGLDVSCMPMIQGRKVNLAFGVKAVRADGVEPETNQMHIKTMVGDHGGVFIIGSDAQGAAKSRLAALVRVQLITNGPPAKTFYRLQSILKQGDSNSPPPKLAERLQAIIRPAGSNTNGAEEVLVGQTYKAASGGGELLTRLYKVDERNFKASLQKMMGTNENDSVMMRKFLTSLGIDMTQPGKAVFLNDRNGMLLVRVTAEDLKVVDAAIEALNNSDAQIHIKARFIAVPRGTVDGFEQFMISSNHPVGLVGILTPENARAAIHGLELRKDVEFLAEPEVVMGNGRQAQIRSTQVVTLVTNSIYVEAPTNSHTGSVTFQTGPVEFGPIFDVAAYTLPDGYSINLDARATLSEFFGYAKPNKKVSPQWVTNSAGEKLGLPVFLPAVQTRRGSAFVNLFDDQTVVLTLGRPEQVLFTSPNPARESLVAKQIADAEKEKGGEKEVVVFATVTLVDAAGNRVHTEKEMSSFRESEPIPIDWDRMEGMRLNPSGRPTVRP